jgi:RHS repeat-associated protein
MHQRIKETIVKRLLVWLAAACLLPLSAAAQNVTYIHTDALGSPVLETNAQAQVVRQVDYRAYGMEVMDAPRPGPGYTGHYRDVGTGLVYMQQRYYDPVIGRFLSVDPVPTDVTNGDAFNRFRYASNNPFRFIDPDGRKDRELPKELTRQAMSPLGMERLFAWTRSMSEAKAVSRCTSTRTARTFAVLLPTGIPTDFESTK